MAGAAGQLWTRLPLTLRAILVGLFIGLGAANVLPVLAALLGPTAWTAAGEIVFLVLYLAWVSGLGPPRAWISIRRTRARARGLSNRDWAWGLLAATAFAVTIHAALVVVFRLTPFPAAAFHEGYDISFVPGAPARWVAVIIAAASAGVCEEVGFRGYMQQPIEARHGPIPAILISATLFTLFHVNKGWMLVGVAPVVLMAGLMLGALAWASRSLVFCMIGHTLMDIGLFAYWWTQIAGVYRARTIFETGLDTAFFVACAALAGALTVTLLAIRALARLRP